MASKNNTGDDSESFKSLSETLEKSEVLPDVVNKDPNANVFESIYKGLKVPDLDEVPNLLPDFEIEVKPLKEIETNNNKFIKIYFTCNKDEKFLFLFFKTKDRWDWSVFRMPEITDDEIQKILAENLKNSRVEQIASDQKEKPTNENDTENDFGTNPAVGVNPDLPPTLPIAYVTDTDIGDLSLDNNYPFYFKTNSNDGEYNNSPIEIQYYDTQESSYEPTSFSTSFSDKVSKLFSRGVRPNTIGYYEKILRKGGAPDILIRLFKSFVDNNGDIKFTEFLNNEIQNSFIAKHVRDVLQKLVKDIIGIEYNAMTTDNGPFEITSTETLMNLQNLSAGERIFFQYLLASLAIKFDQEVKKINMRSTLLQSEEMSLNEKTQTMIGETLLFYEGRETIISRVIEDNMPSFSQGRALTTPLKTNLIEGEGLWDDSIKNITDNNPDTVNLKSFDQLASGRGVVFNIIKNREKCNSISSYKERIKCRKYVLEQIKHVHEILKGIGNTGEASEKNLKLFLFIFGPNTCTAINDGLGDIPNLLYKLEDMKTLYERRDANETPTLSVDNNQDNQITRVENTNEVKITLIISGETYNMDLLEINDSQFDFLQTSVPIGEDTQQDQQQMIQQQIKQISLKDLQVLHNEVTKSSSFSTIRNKMTTFLGYSLKYKQNLFYKENKKDVDRCIYISRGYLNQGFLTQDTKTRIELLDLKKKLQKENTFVKNMFSRAEALVSTITNMIQNPIYVVTGGIAFIGFTALCKYFIQEKVKKMTPCEKVETKLKYKLNESK